MATLSDPPNNFYDIRIWLKEVANFVLTGTTMESGVANLVFASPNGAPGAPSLRALVSADIPNLDAVKITTGVFADARIPSLDASKITTGVFDAARIPSLDTSKVTTGVFDNARVNWAVPNALGSTTPNTVSATNMFSLLFFARFYTHSTTSAIADDAGVVQATVGAITLTLPDASTHFLSPYSAFLVVKNSSAGSITVQRTGTDTIDGVTSFSLGAGLARMIVAISTNLWISVGDYD